MNYEWLTLRIFFSSVILLPDHAIFQGDGVIYFVTAKVKQGWVNLDVEVTGAEGFTAANVRVVSQGTVAYIPSSWMVRSVDGDTVKVIPIYTQLLWKVQCRA